jgi:hypothetical protein
MSNTLTPEFRVSWPKVFKPERNELNGKDEYSVQALFAPGTDMSKLVAAAQAALTKTWGEDKTKWPQNLKTPFKTQSATRIKDGKQVPNDGHVDGAPMLTLKTTQKPGVVDSQVQPILNEAEFYAGCYAIASVNASTYDQKGNRGVSFYLQNIQKVRDGDALAGRAKPENEFAPVSTPVSADKSATSLF